MTPQEAMRATGRGPSWTARRVGVERTRLYRLLDGRAPWTAELRDRFALALGVEETAIEWPTEGKGEAA